MGRTKSNRNITFKPLFRSYIPEDKEYENIVVLLDEEIEAIYLMDVKGLYQEDAAKNMDVSRPTFTRIIKNARRKLASAIVSGSKIEIEQSKEFYIIALCADEDLKNITPLEEYIYIFNLQNKKMVLIEKIKNPSFEGKNKVAQVLPEILLNKNANIFVSSKVGEGLKNSLIAKGIRINIKNKIDLDDFTI